MQKKLWKRTILWILAAVVLILASLFAYEIPFKRYDAGTWQAFDFDQADYRYIAEHFWGVPHDPKTYDADFNGDWGRYLRLVPFRDIGIGTYYLTVRSLSGLVQPAVLEDPALVAPVMSWSLKILLIIALLLFFESVRRRFGTVAAFLSLAVLIFPPRWWILTEDLMAEPLLRILFILLLAILISYKPPKLLWIGVLAFLTLILATQVKVQFLAAAPILLIAFLWEWYRVKLPWYQAGVLVGMAALVPLSVMLVHYIGWQSLSLSPAAGLHLNFKLGHTLLPEFCAAEDEIEMPVICDPEKPRIGWWNIYFGEEMQREDLERLDRFVLLWLLRHPQMMLKDAWHGIAESTDFRDGLLGFRSLIDFVTFLTWLLLLIGTTLPHMRLMSIASVSLWIVPALGNVVGAYDPRYHRPMAGIALAVAILITMELWRALRSGDNLWRLRLRIDRVSPRNRG